ncbi:MAG: T9SS type A sorting domain-containing protein [Flavobacterium sp.]|nr:T9SS type A sorting domain-containing protein [Flavobacterium sp.]
MIICILGGTNLTDYAPTQDTFAWFDEFRVSTQRINEWGNYNTLSSDNFEKANEITLYPNPSNGLVTIKLNTTENVKITLNDILGKEVYQTTLQNDNPVFNKNIDLNHLEKGLYIVLLEFEGKSHTKKLIIE